MYQSKYRTITVCSNLFAKVLVVLLLVTAGRPAEARAPRSCRIFSEHALECLGVDDDGYQDLLKTYCRSLYSDTRDLMIPNSVRGDLRETLREIPCDAIKARGPFAALDDAVTAFRSDHDLDGSFEEHGSPARKRRWLITQRMRREWISYPHLWDCPAYDDGAMPQTRICAYHEPAAPTAERPDLVLVLSGGMVTGMTLLRFPAQLVIATLSERFDVWAYVAESAPLHSVDIAALRWQVANLARGFVEEHPGSRVVVMGYSNGAAQVFHAINEVFPRNRFADAHPALAILMDIVDATPFVERTLTVAPGTRVLAFHGAYATPSPLLHGAHHLRCVDPAACEIHAVHHPDGRIGNHPDIPGLIANTPAYRQVLIDALNAAVR